MVSIGACSSQSVPGPPGIDSVGTGYCTGIIWATSDYGAGTRFEFMPFGDGLGSSTVHTLWCCRGLRLAEYSHSLLLTHFHSRRQKDAPSGASYRKNQPRLGMEETREREREREIYSRGKQTITSEAPPSFVSLRGHSHCLLHRSRIISYVCVVSRRQGPLVRRK